MIPKEARTALLFLGFAVLGFTSIVAGLLYFALAG